MVQRLVQGQAVLRRHGKETHNEGSNGFTGGRCVAEENFLPFLYRLTPAKRYKSWTLGVGVIPGKMAMRHGKEASFSCE